MGDAGVKKKKKRTHGTPIGKVKEPEEVTGPQGDTNDSDAEYSCGENEAWDSDDDAPFLRYIFDKQEKHGDNVKISEAATEYVVGVLPFNCNVCKSSSRPYFNKKKTAAGLCSDSNCEAAAKRVKKDATSESSEGGDELVAPAARAKSRSTLKAAIGWQQAKITCLMESARIIQEELSKEEAI